MGIGIMSCSNSSTPATNNGVPVAPNPDPDNCEVTWKRQLGAVCVLGVSYRGCTNFEGRKILVMTGQCEDFIGKRLDPHFVETDDRLLARFRPDVQGFKNACAFAKRLGEPKESVVTCVYCGHTYPKGTPTHKADMLTAHIKICDKHPMREMEEHLRSANRELERLRKELLAHKDHAPL